MRGLRLADQESMRSGFAALENGIKAERRRPNPFRVLAIARAYRKIEWVYLPDVFKAKQRDFEAVLAGYGTQSIGRTDGYLKHRFPKLNNWYLVEAAVAEILVSACMPRVLECFACPHNHPF